MDTVRNALGRWGRKVGEATRKAEDLAGNTWQHLKTSPSFAEAAMGRIARGTKVLVEGGYEKIFRQTFEIVPEEQLQNSFACYLSTSAGPVMGVFMCLQQSLHIAVTVLFPIKMVARLNGATTRHVCISLMCLHLEKIGSSEILFPHCSVLKLHHINNFVHWNIWVLVYVMGTY
ncbi:hypothetical protein CRYUN_Cryun22dG0077300 [Craigia yunnanensis]